MIGAILKISYNVAGERNSYRGICGTCFFIKPRLGLTAQHVLKREIFEPEVGHNYCKLWIVFEDRRVIELKREFVTELPQIDTSVIKISDSLPPTRVLRLSDAPPVINEEVMAIGYRADEMPLIYSDHCEGNNYYIDVADASGSQIIMSGTIRNIYPLSINALDVKLYNTIVIDPSFNDVPVGMSGGPLIRKSTKEVIGIMSFGLPINVNIKDRIFVISIEEIKKYI